MTSKKFLYLSIGLLFYWLFTITILHNNLNTPIRIFSDEFDRFVYFQRGSWLPNDLVPFRDVLSEYPQVPTYLFGLLRLVSLKDVDMAIAYWKFSAVFSMLMLICLVAIINILINILPNKKYLAYLLLLPAPLYFTFNRFDVLPALLSLLAFQMIEQKRWNLAAFLLAIGTMTKWYPCLLLPVSFAYCYRTEQRIHWQMVLIFLVTCLFIVLPTYIFGGMDAVLAPYRFHNQRSIETVSLPALVSNLLNAENSIQSTLMPLFFVLQLLPAIFAIFFRINTHEKLLYWYIIIICNFIIFARIYSPQWLLWVFPFFILSLKNKIDIGIAVFYGISNYIGFPITWDYFGKSSPQLAIMGALHIIILAAIIWSAVQKLGRQNSNLLIERA